MIDDPKWLPLLIEVTEDPDVDPRAELADFTLIGLLMDEIHKHLRPNCIDTVDEHGDYDGGTTCFLLAYELTLQGWTLPRVDE